MPILRGPTLAKIDFQASIAICALLSYHINTNIELLEQKVMQLSNMNNQFETQLKTFEEKLSALEQKIYQAAPSETTVFYQVKNQKLLILS